MNFKRVKYLSIGGGPPKAVVINSYVSNSYIAGSNPIVVQSVYNISAHLVRKEIIMQ